jgi:ATP-binding cassette subfamily A (ABC1) protein 3
MRLLGIGYHLTVVKNPSCNVDRVLERIRSHVPETQLESNVGAELSFILPKEQSSQFEHLFTDLEQNRRELGIDSFRASVTTLEEVFLKYVPSLHLNVVVRTSSFKKTVTHLLL